MKPSNLRLVFATLAIVHHLDASCAAESAQRPEAQRGTKNAHDDQNVQAPNPLPINAPRQVQLWTYLVSQPFCSKPGESREVYEKRFVAFFHQMIDWEPVGMSQYPVQMQFCTAILFRRSVLADPAARNAP